MFFFLFVFDLFSVHWLPTQTLSFPRRRTSVRIDVFSLNRLCSNKDVLYRLCFQRRQKFCTFGLLWRRFVCARLYCRKCTLNFPLLLSECAVLGDSVKILENSWVFFFTPYLPSWDIQEVSHERLALNPLVMLQLSRFSFWSMRLK